MACRRRGHPSLSCMLFDESELPASEVVPEKNFQSLRHPLWTENKARLIQEYIKLFTYVTKHGAYIDGFAAPQRRERLDLCSAKLVLEAEPQRVRDLWLCDIDPKGAALLRELQEAYKNKGRRIHVVEGDFNNTYETILASGRITDRTATFALLDQRTFECAWSTVEAIARHKKGMKIEVFYFLATGWIDRSIAAVKREITAARVERWWGRPDWRTLRGMQGIERANLLVKRFKDELGYTFAYPYAIHDSRLGGRTMYHMIHATDHPEASPLMMRAYRKISGRSDQETHVQLDFDAHWSEFE